MGLVKDNTEHIGKKYGELTVISYFSKLKSVYFRCQCSCGNISETTKQQALNGTASSCGCKRKEKISLKLHKHGLSRHPLYYTWNGMKNRCYSPKNIEYKNYGERGIKMCDEWLNSVLLFIDWGTASGWNKGLQIDRIDTNGDYSPANCRFVTPSENSNNKRNNLLLEINGQTKTIMEWSKQFNMLYPTIKLRFHRGYPIDKMFLPVAENKKRSGRKFDKHA